MPLDPKLTKFTTPAKSIATYNFQDIASGTGVINLFCSRSATTSGTEYQLIQNALKSVRTYSGGTLIGNGVYNFDLTPFTTNRVVSGNAVFSGELTNSSYSIDIKVVHWDGTTETDLCSYYRSSTGGYTPILMNLELTRKQFRIGDVLRVKISVNGAAAGGLWLDPTGEEGEPPIVYIPLEIQE